MIREIRPDPQSVVCVFDIDQAGPDFFGYLELQREIIVDLEVSVILWTTEYEFRQLALHAPNFYEYRSGVFDLTSREVLQPGIPAFIGREKEKAWLAERLAAGGCVVVKGPAGIGKTALAREICAQEGVCSRFAGGIAWIDCSNMRNVSDIILTAAADFLGESARDYPAGDCRRYLDDHLAAEPNLVVLDDFDSIAEDGATLRWLRTIAPPSAALLLSRKTVPILRAPTLELAGLPPEDAVRLFRERAMAAGSDELDDQDILEVCSRLDYNPAMIEIAAPLAAEMPVSALLDSGRARLSLWNQV
jgi:hypothetical protein